MVTFIPFSPWKEGDIQKMVKAFILLYNSCKTVAMIGKYFQNLKMSFFYIYQNYNKTSFEERFKFRIFESFWNSVDFRQLFSKKFNVWWRGIDRNHRIRWLHLFKFGLQQKLRRIFCEFISTGAIEWIFNHIPKPAHHHADAC